jgi:glycosyltransferase involved in cell wall biosynthesis
VVPAYNEARFIRTTVGTVPEYVDQIVVVDDGSLDGTSQQVVECGDRRVMLVRHERNRGVGAAIATGYQLAFGRGADIVAVMAGDGQMDPEDLEGLLRPLLQGRADYVKGNRLSHPQVRRRMPSSRRVGNHLLSLLTRWAIGSQVHDSQCGYTALGRHAAKRLPLDQIWRGYGYPNDLLGWLTQIGASIQEVQVRPIYGEEISGIGLRHALWVIPGVLARVWIRRIKGSYALPNQAVDNQLIPLSQAVENAIYSR